MALNLPIKDIVSLVLIFVVPKLLFPEMANLVILLTLIIIVGRSNLAYHTMDIEVQSLLILILAILYGPFVCFIIAILSTYFAFKLSIYIGLPNPVLTIMDTGLITFICVVGSFMPIGAIIPWGLALLLFMDIARNIMKFFILHEPLPKYFIMTMVYIVSTYLIYVNFGPEIIRWLGGTV